MALSITLSASRDESGQEILEAALVLPILFLVLFAIFWFGRAFNIISTLERAARAGIQTATHTTCASCGNTLASNAIILNSINSAIQADHLNTGNVTAYSPPYACTGLSPSPLCTTQSNVQICTGVPLTCGGAACQKPPAACGPIPPALGTRVTFGYQFDAPLPIVNLPAFTINASAESRSEQ